jgi:hypothetical protein
MAIKELPAHSHRILMAWKLPASAVERKRHPFLEKLLRCLKKVLDIY